MKIVVCVIAITAVASALRVKEAPYPTAGYPQGPAFGEPGEYGPPETSTTEKVVTTVPTTTTEAIQTTTVGVTTESITEAVTEEVTSTEASTEEEVTETQTDGIPEDQTEGIPVEENETETEAIPAEENETEVVPLEENQTEMIFVDGQEVGVEDAGDNTEEESVKKVMEENVTEAVVPLEENQTEVIFVDGEEEEEVGVEDAGDNSEEESVKKARGDFDGEENQRQTLNTGSYYIYHPDRLLQRVAYSSETKHGEQSYSSQLRYQQVEHQRNEPVFVYDPQLYYYTPVYV